MEKHDTIGKDIVNYLEEGLERVLPSPIREQVVYDIDRAIRINCLVGIVIGVTLTSIVMTIFFCV